MIHIELRSDVPIYEQIVRQVKALIVQGALRPGDPLPSIRKLAESTRTNPNTVARAYQELERLGLLENLIGKGAFIRAQPAARPDEAALERIRAQLRPPLMEWMLLGLDREQMLAEVGAILDQLKGVER